MGDGKGQRLDNAYLTKKCFDVRPPTKDNVLSEATSTTHKEVAIPAGWQDQMVTFMADGGKIYILLSTDGTAADKTARSGSGRCIPLADGMPVPFFIAKNEGLAQISMQADSGTPNLCAWISSH